MNADNYTERAPFYPSTITPAKGNEDFGSRDDKKASLERLISGVSISAQATAFMPQHKAVLPDARDEAVPKTMVRPVLLSTIYAHELITTEECPEDLIQQKIKGRELLIVDLSSTQDISREITVIVKECAKMEKSLSIRLELRETTLQINPYITTGEKLFFVSKKKLLGEILKAQRKLERLRLTGSMICAQKCVESFIKKLCTLKIYADKLSAC